MGYIQAALEKMGQLSNELLELSRIGRVVREPVTVSFQVNTDGLTIASSNRNDPDSFVGKSYPFRPNFMQAIAGGQGRYFALGATSMKRGFYASHPARDSNGRIAGVVVIKQDIGEQEAELAGYPNFFLLDPNGIVFLSGSKEMNFKNLWPICRETRLALLKYRQFGEKDFDAILPNEVTDGMEISFNGKNHLVFRKPVDYEGWSIVFLAPTDRILAYEFVGVIITLWMVTVIAVPFIINYRASLSAKISRRYFRESRRWDCLV